jgi:hypothetical protein
MNGSLFVIHEGPIKKEPEGVEGNLFPEKLDNIRRIPNQSRIKACTVSKHLCRCLDPHDYECKELKAGAEELLS